MLDEDVRFFEFLMHRVELKVFSDDVSCKPFGNSFLMHRVELKALQTFFYLLQTFLVPNAPCGVESSFSKRTPLGVSIVPNAPCGVESLHNVY